MKRIAVFLVFLLLLATSASMAQRRFGFGFVFGEPTGLSWKYKLDRMNAFDGVIGFSPEDRFRIHADYLWESHPFNDGAFSLHYGIGAAIGFGRTTYFATRGDYFIRTQELGFAARVPVGIDYEIPRSPCEVYVELAPIVILTPDAGVGIDAGLGIRIYP